jgi:hypothetical protein
MFEGKLMKNEVEEKPSVRVFWDRTGSIEFDVLKMKLCEDCHRRNI